MARSSVGEGVFLPVTQQVHVIGQRGSLGNLSLIPGHPLELGKALCAYEGVNPHDCKHEVPLFSADSWLSWLPCATFSSGLKACFGSFADQVALKLGKRSHDVENHAAHSGRCINVFCKAVKVDATVFKVFSQLHQLLKGTPQPVKFPNDKHVTTPKVLKGTLEFRPVLMNPADMLFKDFVFRDTGFQHRVYL